VATTPCTDLASMHTPPGYGRFTGRIGALAVALGIGLAIANNPGIAAADDGQSTSSEASLSNSGPSVAGTDPAKSSDSPSSDSTSGPSNSSDPKTPSSNPYRSKPAKHQQNSESTAARGARSSRDDDNAKPGSTRDTVSTDSAGETSLPRADAADISSSDRSTGVPQSVATLTNATDGKPATSRPASTETSSTAIAAQAARTSASTPTTLVAVPSVSVTVSTPSTPVAPAPTPTLWTMLGWVRRELGHTAAPSSTSRATAHNFSTVSVTPLGTPEQTAAEKLAAETVKTLPVQLMTVVLRAGWLATAQREFALVGGPDRKNLAQLDRSVDEYAMAAAFQQQLLNPNTPTAVMQVSPPHTWYGEGVAGSRILYDNPDTIYRFMAVNKASSYVITGRFAGEVPAETTFSVLTGLSGTTAAVLSGRNLQVDPDGTFTVTVSGSPAAPGQTNHLQLTSDTTLIAVRNTLSDWNTQQPMGLSIQRISGPPNSFFSQLGGFAIPVIGPLATDSPFLTTVVSLIPPLADPPPLLRGAVTAVVMVLGLQMESRYIAVATTDPITGERSQPNELTDPTSNAEFLATQLQSAGYFQLEDDQALVVTVDPGNAGYLVVPVTNDWTITDNYWDQQTSLNNAQAIPNEDGTYTFVISPTDPGVANWVSTGGLNQGTISIRFQDLDTDSDDLPTVSSQVVSLDELPNVVPPETVYVDAEERRQDIEERQAGFNNRFAPYPQP
jgi:hypothetical protein